MLHLIGDNNSNHKSEVTTSLHSGYAHYVLYLDPLIKGICPDAGLCKGPCLRTSGHGAFSNVQAARRRKTLLFKNKYGKFLDLLYKDLDLIERRFLGETRSKLAGKKPVVRLDGTSDIGLAGQLSKAFPLLMFSDYTKNYKRALANTIDRSNGKSSNWHVSFSLSEGRESELHAYTILELGGNVAAPVAIAKTDKIGTTGLSRIQLMDKVFPVVDGDAHDLRFLDPPGSVAVLRPKGRARNILPSYEGFIKPKGILV